MTITNTTDANNNPIRVVEGYLDGSNANWFNGRKIGTVAAPTVSYGDAAPYYIDNIITATTPILITNMYCRFALSGQSNQDQNGSNRFVGLIDEFRMYKGRSLNQTEISALQQTVKQLTGEHTSIQPIILRMFKQANLLLSS